MVERLGNKKHDDLSARISLTTSVCILGVFANSLVLVANTANMSDFYKALSHITLGFSTVEKYLNLASLTPKSML